MDNNQAAVVGAHAGRLAVRCPQPTAHSPQPTPHSPQAYTHNSSLIFCPGPNVCRPGHAIRKDHRQHGLQHTETAHAASIHGYHVHDGYGRGHCRSERSDRWGWCHSALHAQVQQVGGTAARLAAYGCASAAPRVSMASSVARFQSHEQLAPQYDESGSKGLAHSTSYY